MSQVSEIKKILHKHLQSIQENNIETYHQTTAKDLTLYEWWITPNRIDGLPFHDFMMEGNAAQGTVFGSDTGPVEEHQQTRFDLSNLKIQEYADTAIASYTLLISTRTSAGVSVISHNESRVMVRKEGAWQVVHVHKSPAYQAPHSNTDP
jgi:ketosteroid isomerase-like protein